MTAASAAVATPAPNETMSERLKREGIVGRNGIVQTSRLAPTVNVPAPTEPASPPKRRPLGKIAKAPPPTPKKKAAPAPKPKAAPKPKSPHTTNGDGDLWFSFRFPAELAATKANIPNFANVLRGAVERLDAKTTAPELPDGTKLVSRAIWLSPALVQRARRWDGDFPAFVAALILRTAKAQREAPAVKPSKPARAARAAQ